MNIINIANYWKKIFQLYNLLDILPQRSLPCRYKIQQTGSVCEKLPNANLVFLLK